MIRVKAAYRSKDGRMLFLITDFRGGTTVPAILNAIGDVVARLVHHAVAIHSGDIDPAPFTQAIAARALEIFKTLPVPTKENTKQLLLFDNNADAEPDYSGWPSGDDEQTLSLSLSMYANGYPIAQLSSGTTAVPFDEIPIAAALLLGNLAAHALTGLQAPANTLGNDEALSTFKGAWEASIVSGQQQKLLATAKVHQQRIESFVHNKHGGNN